MTRRKMRRLAILLMVLVGAALSIGYAQLRSQRTNRPIQPPTGTIRWTDTLNNLCGQERPDVQAQPFRQQLVDERIAQSFWLLIRETLNGDEPLFTLTRETAGFVPRPLQRAVDTGYLNFFFDLGYDPVVWNYNHRVLKAELSVSEIPPAAREPNLVFISHLHETHHRGGFRQLLVQHPGIPLFFPTTLIDGKSLTHLAAVAPKQFGHFALVDPRQVFKLPDGFTRLTARLSALVLTFNEKDGVLNRETTLLVDTADGLVIVSGCSHATPEKVIKQARRATGRPVHRFVGGTEWISVSKNNFISQMEGIHAMMPDIWLCPNHCTPNSATKPGRRIFGDHYRPLRLGARIELPAPNDD